MFHRSIFNDISILHQEMNALFPRPGLSSSLIRADAGPAGNVHPGLNLYVTDTGYIIESPLPGVDEESIEVSLTENTLTLTAEQPDEEEIEDERQWHRRERNGGKYVHRIELPDDVDASGIQAEYRQGILQVTVPKAEAALPKKISVQVN